jgi:hypothetical protein
VPIFPVPRPFRASVALRMSFTNADTHGIDAAKKDCGITEAAVSIVGKSRAT